VHKIPSVESLFDGLNMFADPGVSILAKAPNGRIRRPFMTRKLDKAAKPVLSTKIAMIGRQSDLNI